MDQNITELPVKRIRPLRSRMFFGYGSIFLIFAVMAYLFFLRPPHDFPIKTLVTVEDGKTLSSISSDLKEIKVVRSSFLFNSFVILFGRERGILSGDYIFESPLTSYQVAKKLTKGEFGLSSRKITIPEGFTTDQIAQVFSKEFYRFDSDAFLNLAKTKEGYLFPDTYFFLPNAEAEEVLNLMEKNFKEKLDVIKSDLDSFGKPLPDIITMASILEEEARTTESRRIVAGILWKRLSIGMPLQVDATLSYVFPRNTFELTVEDLKSDSPYNSYKFKGLPPGPIANPGIDSILAAVHPIETKYLYYLSDKEGGMHYAKTFEDHKKNRRLYLD